MNPDTTPANVPASADEIRSKIVEQFTMFQPSMAAYHEYAARIAALSVEYHNTRIAEVLNVPIEEAVLLVTLDARETPKSLDEKLTQIAKVPGTKVKRVIFDRTKGHYHLFI